MADVGVVGKKYDLYPPKGIREKLKLKPGQRVLYRVEGERLVVEVIPGVAEAERLPKFGETTIEEFDEFTKELQQKTFTKLKSELQE
jgi:bifunctional DNA-binding transcriptional regulator/antitoxin component of YhaV-PrlF toxin-antitoxin module